MRFSDNMEKGIHVTVCSIDKVELLPYRILVFLKKYIHDILQLFHIIKRLLQLPHLYLAYSFFLMSADSSE